MIWEEVRLVWRRAPGAPYSHLAIETINRTLCGITLNTSRWLVVPAEIEAGLQCLRCVGTLDRMKKEKPDGS